MSRRDVKLLLPGFYTKKNNGAILLVNYLVFLLVGNAHLTWLSLQPLLRWRFLPPKLEPYPHKRFRFRIGVETNKRYLNFVHLKCLFFRALVLRIVVLTFFVYLLFFFPKGSSEDHQWAFCHEPCSQRSPKRLLHSFTHRVPSNNKRFALWARCIGCWTEWANFNSCTQGGRLLKLYDVFNYLPLFLFILIMHFLSFFFYFAIKNGNSRSFWPMIEVNKLIL
jgi:hypothetical protein